MDELMDLMATDESPSQISDKIKDMLYAKSSDRVNNFRPEVASSVFDSVNAVTEPEVEAIMADEGGEE
jgi:hypothetical protein|tara:strand:+ start:116 stop:319 length:204 start_codon:yes stop_codon:yes gene_type:complete